MAGAISLRGVSLGYPTPGGTRWILDDTTLEIERGEFVVVLGPSGGGKSTLLAALLGLDDPYAPRLVRRGAIELLGTPVRGELPKALHGRIGAVFQEGALVDELSPRANVRLAARPGRPGRERVDETLAAVGLAHPPPTIAALSGGERRRVSLARALVRDPQLIFLDEPTAGLDDSTAHQVAELIRRMHDEPADRTTVVVTHDLAAFRAHADTFLLLDSRRGTLTRVAAAALDPALEQLEAATARPAAPPPIQPTGIGQRLRRRASQAALALAAGAALLPATLRHAVPYHLGMLGRALLDTLVGPALFYAIAAATGGALVTTFVLENNPLESGFRREALIGSGVASVGVFIPLLTGLLFAARTSAGATARIGALRHQRVFEALPLHGISPIAFFLIPLLYASILSSVVLTALAIVAGLGASLSATLALTDLSPYAWATATFAAVERQDLLYVFGKALLGGAAIAWISFHRASRRQGSAQDVAEATNGAIIGSTLAVLVLHGLLTLRQFGDVG